MQNATFSETVAVVGKIDPDAYSTGNQTTDWVDLGLFEEVTAIVAVGDMTANCTVDCILQQATDSSGTGAKAISGKAITQLTQAGSDDNKQVVMSVRAEDLDVDNGFTHAAAVLTIATAGTDADVTMLGRNPRFSPASDNDLASVDEIV